MQAYQNVDKFELFIDGSFVILPMSGVINGWGELILNGFTVHELQWIAFECHHVVKSKYHSLNRLESSKLWHAKDEFDMRDGLSTVICFSHWQIEFRVAKMGQQTSGREQTPERKENEWNTGSQIGYSSECTKCI